MARGALTPLTLSRGPAADNEPASSASYVHTPLTRVNTFKLANKDAAAHTGSSFKHGELPFGRAGMPALRGRPLLPSLRGGKEETHAGAGDLSALLSIAPSCMLLVPANIAEGDRLLHEMRSFFGLVSVLLNAGAPPPPPPAS